MFFDPEKQAKEKMLKAGHLLGLGDLEIYTIDIGDARDAAELSEQEAKNFMRDIIGRV